MSFSYVEKTYLKPSYYNVLKKNLLPFTFYEIILGIITTTATTNIYISTFTVIMDLVSMEISSLVSDCECEEHILLLKPNKE